MKKIILGTSDRWVVCPSNPATPQQPSDPPATQRITCIEDCPIFKDDQRTSVLFWAIVQVCAVPLFMVTVVLNVLDYYYK